MGLKITPELIKHLPGTWQVIYEYKRGNEPFKELARQKFTLTHRQS